MIEWRIKGDSATAHLGHLLILQVDINLRPGRVTYEACVEDGSGGIVLAFRGGLASMKEAQVAAERAARGVLQRGLNLLDNTHTLITESAVCSLCEPSPLTETEPEKCWIAICDRHGRAIFWTKLTSEFEGYTDVLYTDHGAE